MIPCSYWASVCLAVLPSCMTSYVVSVRQVGGLPVVSLFPHPASFRSHLAVGTLAFGCILPTTGRIRDFHPLETCAARRTKSKEHPVSGMPFPLLYSVFVRFDRKYGFTFSKSHTKAMHFQNSAFTRPLRYPVQFRSISQMLLYRRQFRFRGSSLRCFLSDIPKDLLRT